MPFAIYNIKETFCLLLQSPRSPFPVSYLANAFVPMFKHADIKIVLIQANPPRELIVDSYSDFSRKIDSLRIGMMWIPRKSSFDCVFVYATTLWFPTIDDISKYQIH